MMMLLTRWRDIALAFLIAMLAVQTVRIEGLRIWPLSIAGYKAELHDAKAELARIREAKDKQRETTIITVERAHVIQGDAEKRARRVEEAPTPVGCQTAPEVLGADL